MPCDEERNHCLSSFAYKVLRRPLDPAGCQYSMAEENPAAQRQTAVTVHLEIKQLLQFGSTRWQERILQWKRAVTPYLESKQLLLFALCGGTRIVGIRTMGIIAGVDGGGRRKAVIHPSRSTGHAQQPARPGDGRTALRGTVIDCV